MPSRRLETPERANGIGGGKSSTPQRGCCLVVGALFCRLRWVGAALAAGRFTADAGVLPERRCRRELLGALASEEVSSFANLATADATAASSFSLTSFSDFSS